MNDPFQPEGASGRSHRGTWLGVLLIVGVGLTLLLLRDTKLFRDTRPRHPAVGAKMPKLDLVPLVRASREVHLSDVHGQVVLINFWATWCPPCRQEFPHIVDLYEQFGDNDEFRLLSVSCDEAADPQALWQLVAAYLDRAGATMPVYTENDASTRMQFMMLSGGMDLGIPLTILLDREGVIREVWKGYAPGYEDEMAAEVEKLLAED